MMALNVIERLLVIDFSIEFKYNGLHSQKEEE